jgi:hypothetical protein
MINYEFLLSSDKQTNRYLMVVFKQHNKHYSLPELQLLLSHGHQLLVLAPSVQLEHAPGQRAGQSRQDVRQRGFV